MSDKLPEKKNNLYASELVEKLFSQILLDSSEYNSEVVSVVKSHLGGDAPLSKAGNNLANELIELAKKRAKEDQK
jgi:hypothetical protein